MAQLSWFQNQQVSIRDTHRQLLQTGFKFYPRQPSLNQEWISRLATNYSKEKRMLNFKIVLGTLFGLCLTTQIAQANSVKIHNHTCMCACVKMKTLGVNDGRKKCTNPYNTATSSTTTADIIQSMQVWLYNTRNCDDRSTANLVSYEPKTLNKGAGTYAYRVGAAELIGENRIEMYVQSLGDGARGASITELNRARAHLSSQNQCTIMSPTWTSEQRQ